MSLFALGQSAVIEAGAGAGKTHSLVTLCLHLLGGAGRGAPLPPARLCAVTFTEKAAAELHGRVRARVDALAACATLAQLTALAGAHEPELVASCAALGAPLPAPEVWRRARRDLGQAEIGTIHALCARLLRRHAAAAGLDPDFAVLEGAEATALRREACERAALDALDEPAGAARAAAEALCEELGLRAPGPAAGGLAEVLLALLARLAEGGLSPAGLVAATPGLDPEAAAAADAEARLGLAGALAALDGLLRSPRTRPSPPVQRAREACARFAAALPALQAAAPGGLRAAWPALATAAACLGNRGESPLGQAVGAVKKALERLLGADAGVRACGLARQLALLAERALARYAAAKARAGGLDFDDLTRCARDLLASDHGVRRAEKERIGALLVDEFQDTSRVQLELFGWLAEDPAACGAAPAASGLPGALPVPAGRIAVVGDRKQSIYEFRGADVASAQRFSAALRADGATRHLLRTSRRSLPQLVAFTNLLFRRALGDGGEPWETPFLEGEDDLLAARPAAPGGPRAEFLLVEGKVEEEAEAVARRIAALLAPGAAEQVRERDAAGEAARPVRGGDVAVLLRSFTHVEAFRRALLRQRLPHLVLKGRGFHETREVADLRALLRFLADRRDAAALAAVLRSPLGPLSDDGLVILSRGPRSKGDGPPGPRRRLSHGSLSDPGVRALLAPDDAAVVEGLGPLLDRLSREAGRLGPHAILEIAIAETGYAAALAGGVFGEQALANVERLLELARAAELATARPGGPLRALLARLEALEQERGEAEAPVVEERDPHAVRLLTVHAAKGLEFPVVFVPLCGLAPPLPDALLVDPDLGLSLKVRGADGAWEPGLHGRAVRERRLRRAAAEGRRLLYVAATRARDLLVFSSRPAQRPDTWRRLLDEVAGLPEARPLLRLIEARTLAAPPLAQAGPALESSAGLEADLASPGEGGTAAARDPAAPAGDHAAAPAPGGEAAEALARALRRGQPPPAPGTLIAPVTQLADAAACPRRYQLLHEAGLPERPWQEPALPPALAAAPAGERDDAPDLEAAEDLEGGPPEPPPLPAAERGTLAHRLLEVVPLDPAAPPAALRAAARRALEEEGRDPGAHELLVESVAAFLGSELGRRLALAPAGRLFRELPFALHLEPLPGEPPGPALVVRGQLDALLLDEGAATVIDYKHSERRDPARYAAQLSAYALAAWRFTGGVLPVRAGVVFLRSPGTPFAALPPADAGERARTRLSLLAAAASIAEGRRSGRFPIVEPAVCRAIGCGFLRRCHPREEGELSA